MIPPRAGPTQIPKQRMVANSPNVRALCTSGTVRGMIAPPISIITGAPSGIGRAAAIAIAERGATVFALARNGAALDELAAGGARD